MEESVATLMEAEAPPDWVDERTTAARISLEAVWGLVHDIEKAVRDAHSATYGLNLRPDRESDGGATRLCDNSSAYLTTDDPSQTSTCVGLPKQTMVTLAERQLQIFVKPLTR